MISFLDWIKENFEVWSVDGEFRMDKTETIPKKVLCMVYQNVFTGELRRYWEHDRPSGTPHFDFDNVLLVSFNAVAVIGVTLDDPLQTFLPQSYFIKGEFVDSL